MLPQMQKNYINYLNSKQIQEVQKAFRIFDQDGSGSISIRQFDQILKSLGQSLSDQQLQSLVEEIDRDGNGFIDFQEFLFLVAPKIIGKRTQKSYIQAFRLINNSNSGFISLTELIKSNQVTKAGLSETQISDIMSFIDEKYGGKLNVNTMLKMLCRKPQKQ